METHYRVLAEKYLANKCSPEEEVIVRQWFTTPEGQQFLVASINQDLENPENQPAENCDPPIDSESILQKIKQAIDKLK